MNWLDNLKEKINKSKILAKGKKKYYETFLCYDIEVTNYYEETADVRVGIPYLMNITDGENTFFMRDFTEFKKLIEKINIMLDARLIIYVHNLSYEWQFMRTYLEFDEVFLTQKRKVLFCRYRNIEFRCSYFLFNMSLKKVLETYEIKEKKLDYNYNEKRYPWEELTKLDYEYNRVDTESLHQAIEKLLEKENSNVARIPYTSTGFVRRDVKRCMPYNKRRKYNRINEVTPELYTALKSAFVGGNTHANRLYSARIIDNIYCYDITSSYPYVQCTEQFPITPFKKTKVQRQNRLCKGYAYLLRIEFCNIKLKDAIDGMPTISKNKCLELEGYTLDNGRVLTANRLRVWVTDIELSIINNHYRYTGYTILDGYCSRYGELPEEIKATIFHYYKFKNTLKGKDDYMYRKSKEKLNSIYGMSAFDIGRANYIYKDGEVDKDKLTLEEILKHNTVDTMQAEPYAWGVWTTAHARKNLDEVIRLAGDSFVYCDTDSVYMVGECAEIKKINERIYKKSEYKINDNRYLGKWELDKHCKHFITFGAKKYAYTDDAGECHTVTAGVSRQAGVDKIEDYRIGHTFKNATNLSWYTDEPVTVTIDGHTITVPSSIYIESGDYTLGVTEYQFALFKAIYGEDSEEVYFE